MKNNQGLKAYIKEGNKFKRNGQFEAAIASYQKAVAINPQFSWSYFYLGETLFKQKRLDEAMEAYRKAIELNPNQACFHSGLGDISREKGEVNEALKCYQNADKSDGNFELKSTGNFNDEKASKKLIDLEAFNLINYKGQLLQDKWVIMMTKGKQKGVFLEIGSTDGVELNNTFCLEKSFSWSGICVEPNPDFFKKLCVNRTAITLPYAFSKESGQIVEFVNHGVLGTIAEFSSTDLHAPKREKFISAHGTIKVITARPEEILSLYKFPEYFDFLSLDVEGAELDVLESFNLSKWHPALACIEHNSVADKRAAIFEILSSYGYQRMECKFDDWYYNLDALEILNPEIPLSHYHQVVEYFCKHHGGKLIDGVSVDSQVNKLKEKPNDLATRIEGAKLSDREKINNDELVNIALGKTASQSSYSQWSQPDDPSKALNGIKNGKFSFCTALEEKPWWIVDLGDAYPIDLIKIFNREDCASERVKGLEILFSLDSEQWRSIAVVNYTFGGYLSGQPLAIDFRNLPDLQWVRFVKLQLQTKNYLHLDEVEIFLNQEAFRIYQISKELNFDYKALWIKKKFTTYTILNYELWINKIKSGTRKIDAIEISFTGRFGNSIHQLINAFYYCEQNQIFKIYTKDDFPYISLKCQTQQSEEIELLVKTKPQSEEVVLSGVFFHARHIKLAYSYEEYVNIFDKYVLPKIKLPQSSVKVGGADLVIYFRAGDIFKKSPSPAGGYGQPPLSFYQKVIAVQKPDRCILVFEDKGNPCIEELENFLVNEGIPYICQSSDVYSDISCLANSVNLIVGRGTFCDSITLLAKNLKEVYIFENGYKFELALLRGARVFKVYDKTGKFKEEVLNRNWKNTKEQRELMINYDVSHLAIENINKNV